MRLLIDTHIFLWFIEGDSRLSLHSRNLITDEGNENFISMASLWEMAIKIGTGKLTIAPDFSTRIPAEIDAGGFQVLDIGLKHCEYLIGLPLHHRDPFDRMLAAQSLVEEMPLISADTIFDAYDVNRLY